MNVDKHLLRIICSVCSSYPLCKRIERGGCSNAKKVLKDVKFVLEGESSG